MSNVESTPVMNAVTAIMDDHRLLERLLDRIRSAVCGRARLIAEMRARLEAHRLAEETTVYPAVRACAPGEPLDGHRAQDRAEQRLDALATARAPAFPAAFAGFRRTLVHHIVEEEGELLPRLRRSVPPGLLRELGQDFEARRVGELDRRGLAWSVHAR